MRNHPHSKAVRHGFSLLELSIVLAVIGLLIGGIASMRNYVNNAKLTTLVNEAKFYISAFNQFQTRYNAPPGDYNTASSAWTGAGDGDGNGLIRADTSMAGNVAEMYYAWQHLALAGYISGNYTGAANSNGGATIGLNVPGGAFEGSAYVFNHPNGLDGMVSGDPLFPAGYYGNILQVAGSKANSNSTPDGVFLTPKQAYQIDDKFDDGINDAGTILVPRPTALANCTSGGAYNTTYQSAACWLIFRMQ